MDITFVDLVLFILGLLIVLYYYGTWTYNHFTDSGITHVKPSFPFVGNMASIFQQKEHVSSLLSRYYAIDDQKYVGIFEGRKPLLMIKDMELLKMIAVKDFNSFHDHQGAADMDKMDSLFGNSLVALQGDKWKDMRATLSPAFTSAKVKKMFTLIDDCAKDFAEYFVEQAKNGVDNMVEIETKDSFMRYTNDVIATSAFGLKINTLRNKDHEFYKMSKDASDFSGNKMLKIMIAYFFPMIFKLLKLTVIPEKTGNFIRTMVNSTMLYRTKSGTVRNDMIDLLMEAKRGSLKYNKNEEESDKIEFADVEESDIGKRTVVRNWSDDEISAQAFIFLFAGLEVTSTLIEFFFYEMIKNPDIQKRIQDEIDEFLANSDGNISYEDIKQLKYLDMAVSETLRLWPSTIVTDRVCTNDYIFPPPNANNTKSYKMKKGQNIWIPIWAFHRDPNFYPNPEKFDPERFSDENKPYMNRSPYLPFGIGPRNCIGTKYALSTTKILIFRVLSKFDAVKTENTVIPITLAKTTNRLMPEKPIRIGLKLRKSKST